MIQFRRKIDLEGIKLFADLTENECFQINSKILPRLKNFDKGEIIFQQGDAVTQIAVLVSGKVLSVKYHFDGHSQLLRIFNCGDIIGLEAVSSRMMTSPDTLIADEITSLLLFSYNKMFREDKLPLDIQKKVMENLLHQMANDNIKLMYKNDVLSKRKLRDRILTHLSIMSEKRKEEKIKLGMNQEQFAQYLCVDRSALSSELNLMKKEGLITYNKGYYTIGKQKNNLK
jgi:CRP-like cAMP-binding protein